MLEFPRVLVSRTEKEMQYYLDSINGDDKYDGLTPATAFKTTQKAASVIPDIVNHNITFTLAPGTYDNISILGHVGNGEIIFQGSTTTPTNHIVKGVFPRLCNCTVRIYYIQSIGDSQSQCISSFGSKSLYILSCDVTSAKLFATQIGIEAYMSNVYIANTPISNKDYAVVANECSTIFIDGVGGTGNNTGLLARTASTIGKNGTMPSGTTAETVNTGGLIR